MNRLVAGCEIQAMRMLLLSKLLSYPEPTTGEKIAQLATAAELRHAIGLTSEPLAALGEIVEKLCTTPDALTAFGSDYIDQFDRGMAKASLHETEYGQPLAKGNKLSDISGFYQAFGFAFRTDQAEMLDHVAVELEFYALLLLKHAVLLGRDDTQGSEIVLDARQKFFEAHLGSLLCTLAEQPRLREHAIFGPVVAVARVLADEEAAVLGLRTFCMTPMSVAPPESETMECDTGSGRLPVLN